MSRITPVLVSNNILARSFRDDNLINPMKLQRLLYITSSKYAERAGVLLFDEPFNVWAYGPVVLSVYHEFSGFGSNYIDLYARYATGEVLCADESADETLRSVLDDVWRRFSHSGSAELSDAVRAPGSAWDVAFQRDEHLLDPELIAGDGFCVRPLHGADTV